MLFIALVFAIGFILLIGIFKAGNTLQLSSEIRRRNLAVALFTILGWLSFTLIVSASGWLEDYSAMPPHIFLLTLPALSAVIFAVISKKIFNYANAVSNFWFVYVQSFRILMEFILWLLYRYQIIPVQMTFEGGNFDILVGLSAPVIAYFCFTKNKWNHKVALYWNFAGLALLANIVIIAILSSPLPFRVFMNNPANTIIFSFPFVWLPVFVVPFAVLMHIISIKKLLRPATNA